MVVRAHIQGAVSKPLDNTGDGNGGEESQLASHGDPGGSRASRLRALRGGAEAAAERGVGETGR